MKRPLAKENDLGKLRTEIRRLRTTLREAPMPLRESYLSPEEWDKAYDRWWHLNACEAAIGDEDDFLPIIPPE
jgi:hypothetical protein